MGPELASRIGGAERAVSPVNLRRVMGHFATGVAVVTAMGSDGAPAGTTVNAITSVSLEPPLVLVCLDLASATLRAIGDQGAFAINVLGAEHRHLAHGFARRGELKPWHAADHGAGATGTPRLKGALAALECRVEHRLRAGDHELVLGRVMAAEVGEVEAGPLLFYRGVYSSLERL
jgi:flavin reductase (DIM6/NTAB) family NADH-FMN oxidoreductase RutF